MDKCVYTLCRPFLLSLQQDERKKTWKRPHRNLDLCKDRGWRRREAKRVGYATSGAGLLDIPSCAKHTSDVP